jgi:hypothetical protein
MHLFTVHSCANDGHACPRVSEKLAKHECRNGAILKSTRGSARTIHVAALRIPNNKSSQTYYSSLSNEVFGADTFSIDSWKLCTARHLLAHSFGSIPPSKHPKDTLLKHRKVIVIFYWNHAGPEYSHQNVATWHSIVDEGGCSTAPQDSMCTNLSHAAVPHRRDGSKYTPMGRVWATGIS